MVRAILEGRKTMTRRVIPKQPTIDPQTGDWLMTYTEGREEVLPIEQWAEFRKKMCKFGKPGDRLWVRETWRDQSYSFVDADRNFSEYQYRADWPKGIEGGVLWRPSIFMPRIACRILLEITDIRVERLQDISKVDAIAEGIESFRPVPGDGPAETLYRHYMKGKWGPSPIHSFETLWQSINGPESWEQNPWVWVIAFKRIEQ